MALVLDGGKWVLQAPSSGGSEYDKTPTIIDLTDGSWTLYDPDGLVNTITFSADWHTLTWNALSVGSGDYNWFYGTTIRAPRWYKNLEINGTQVTSVDLLVSSYRMEVPPLFSPDACPFRWLGVFGAALGAGSTVLLLEHHVGTRTWRSTALRSRPWTCWCRAIAWSYFLCSTLTHARSDG